MNNLVVNDKNVRLDRYIRRFLPNLNQSLIEKLLRKGLIKVDNCKAKSNYKVNSGQIITIKYIEDINLKKKYNKKSDKKLIALIKENILYEDEYILAINKPAGVTVQGGKENISDFLDQIRNGETFKIVHRLDRDTSGVMIFARDAKVAKYLMEEFKERKIKKTYVALTSGTPNENNGVINHPLVKKYIFGQEKMVIDENSSQSATTHFSILEKLNHNVAYLKLQPITGRTHQLRAHLAHINCPILGDGKYGGKKAFIDGAENKVHLHSCDVSLILPNNTKIVISAPISDQIKQSMKILSLS